jgi:hypothetical protein
VEPIKCPECGGTQIYFSKAWTYIRCWYQDNKLPDYYDFDEPDSWEGDDPTEFICDNQNCNYKWTKNISPGELMP